MNHGEFYKADELVKALHDISGGVHAGFRAAHAYGKIYAGTFTATPAAKAFSRAVHFQGRPVPVTARFSSPSGNPADAPGPVVAMATKFYLPDGTVTDMIGINLPAFFVRTPDDFIEFIEAQKPDAATGKPDMAKLGAFLEKHPATAKVLQLIQSAPAPVSFAQTRYRALHAYRFINASGASRWARYHWEPQSGFSGQPPEDLAKRSHDHLFGEFEGRLKKGPAVFRLELQLARDGDALDDVTALWPDTRERVEVGSLELTRPITPEEIGDPVMMHDPTRVTDGIEYSPDDEIISARRGAYLVSAAERTGGWQNKSETLTGLCPFGGSAARQEPSRR